ncbi:MAG: 50S ribosomal protein L19e [Nanoarchaeota archaeon]|nr:50S ribosomal protein L19e [Nanoarchaeota archaeon]
MNIRKKKILAANTMGVGKDRIVFNVERLDEIKEAITKQDIRDLVSAGAIYVKDIKGRTAVVKRKTRRRAGSIRKKVKNSKTTYVIITRKLRGYISELRDQEKITEEQFWKLRKDIRARTFKSKSHLKEHLN